MMENSPPINPKETTRIEAFSDGVFAIAITLLILDIKVPQVETLGTTSLLTALISQWPSYVGFVSSFLTILIMWASHHNIFRYIQRTDHLFLFINGLLLMGVTVVPFPTSLLAEHAGHEGQHIAAMVYTGTFFVLALLFNLVWHYAVRNNRLIDKRTSRKWIERINRQYRVGPFLYLASFIVAAFSVVASVGITIALAIFFALPITSNDDIQSLD